MSSPPVPQATAQRPLRDLPRSTKAIYKLRFAVGVVAILVGLGAAISDRLLEPALQFAVLFFGGFVLFHAALDLVFREKVLKTKPAADADPTDGLRGAITALLAAPAAVLGLMSVFGSKFTVVIKVGAVSLVSGVVLAAMLSMFVVLPLSSDSEAPSTNLISAFLQVTLWANVLGLACVGAGIVYASGTR